MKAQQALDQMVYPSMQREKNPHTNGGVIQIWVTRVCDKACFNCTQGSNLRGAREYMPVELFEQAVISLKDYFGVVGVFGGNPATHPQFSELCRIMREHLPFKRRGLWCNNPIILANAQEMAKTFNPAVSNLNVHLDPAAFELFQRGWPGSGAFGLRQDQESRHSPVYVSLLDLKDLPLPASKIKSKEDFGTRVKNTEENRWDLIAECDINRHWSAMIGMFRGELRAWFCEIAGAQSMLMQDKGCGNCDGIGEVFETLDGVQIPEGLDCYYCDGTGVYPDTGIDFSQFPEWWKLPHDAFYDQVKFHCHRCGVPTRGYGELAHQDESVGKEFVSAEYLDIYKPKRTAREVVVCTESSDVQPNALNKFTHYVQNSKK